MKMVCEQCSFKIKIHVYVVAGRCLEGRMVFFSFLFFFNVHI